MLAAMLGLATATAAQADPPTVTLVPVGGRLELSRTLPAGVPWKVVLAVAKDLPVQAVVAIWPGQLGRCDRTTAPDGAQRFALTGDPAAGSLAAELPALQFGLSYCLRLDQRRGLTPIEAERAARPTVDALDPTLRTDPLTADVLGAQLAAELQRVLPQNGIDLTAPTRQALDPLMTGVARDYLFSAAGRDYLVASVAATEARDVTEPAAAAAVAALAATHTATLAGEAAVDTVGPRIVIGDAWYRPAQLWSSPRAATTLTEAQAYLRELQRDPRVVTINVDAWIDALELAKTDFAAAKAISLPAFSPGVIGIWDGAELHPYADLLDGDRVATWSPALLRRAVAQLREHDAIQRAYPTPKLQAALLALADAVASRDRARQEIARTATRADETGAAARTALTTLVTTALRELRIAAAFTSQDTSVLEATPTPSNYASIDLGVAIGLPFTDGGEDLESLWMPYVGVNLYFRGVDRTIPLSQQRGGFLRTRAAITLGFSLDEPTLKGRELQGFLFGKIPFIAVGTRVTQYTRLSLGVMFYQWPDNSPAEDHPDFGAALFVGYSLDLDLLTWIRGNAGGYGGL